MGEDQRCGNKEFQRAQREKNCDEYSIFFCHLHRRDLDPTQGYAQEARAVGFCSHTGRVDCPVDMEAEPRRNIRFFQAGWNNACEEMEAILYGVNKMCALTIDAKLQAFQYVKLDKMCNLKSNS